MENGILVYRDSSSLFSIIFNNIHSFELNEIRQTSESVSICSKFQRFIVQKRKRIGFGIFVASTSDEGIRDFYQRANWMKIVDNRVGFGALLYNQLRGNRGRAKDSSDVGAAYSRFSSGGRIARRRGWCVHSAPSRASWSSWRRTTQLK